MLNTVSTLGTISWGRRLMPATIALGLLLVLVFGLAQSGFAQSGAPLNFGNNFFVRGDYVVAGAYGMTSQFANGYAIGTINVPDKNPATGTANPGITGTTSVPPGAEVVAAVLYWQTVEKIGVMPGQPGSGQNGFFRPVINIGPPAPGYPITGVNLNSGGTNTVSWSSGGCTSGSTGKVIRTYRANVLGALPRDASGNISANGPYEVRLPSTASTTPITLGATLVLIYRIFSPSVPLNSIVIYDGDFAPGNASLTMMQKVQGFYDAANNPVSRLTHIVGNGKSNKFQTVYLDNVALSSLYGGGQPAFPGFYGTWDNPTWTFGNTSVPAIANPVQAGDASATTQVIPSTSNQGCVSWGAVIFSTTVQGSDNDGLLASWKTNQGYCDAVAVDAGTCSRPGDPGWVDLPNAHIPGSGNRDVYIELHYMCSSPNPDGNTCKTGDGINYSFDPRPSGAIDLVAGPNGPFAAHKIYLHINETVSSRPNVANVHAIPEQTCVDNPNIPPLCAFPNPPGTNINRGVVAWPGGFLSLKSQLVDLDDPTNLNGCTTSPPAADCVPRFQPGAAPSKHEVIFAHAVGQPKWKLQDGTLVSVSQLGNTVTFTTSMPVGTLNILG